MVYFEKGILLSYKGTNYKFSRMNSNNQAAICLNIISGKRIVIPLSELYICEHGYGWVPLRNQQGTVRETDELDIHLFRESVQSEELVDTNNSNIQNFEVDHESFI